MAWPPSGMKARVWTIVGSLSIWFLIPVAIHYQRKARAEAEASGGAHEWPRTVWNRPVLLWGIELGVGTALLVVMLLTGIYPGGE